jgi:multidrug efflux pump subunit AcrA (membrane-fusion protein)
VVRLLSILAAVVGLIIGVVAIGVSTESPPVPPLARRPSVNPFEHGVAALGFIEPSGRAVGVGVPEAGVVTKVLVDVGDRVEAGQVLLSLDDRPLRAQLVRAEAERAMAVLSDRREQLTNTQEARQRGAATDRDVSLMRHTVDAAQADLDGASAALARLQAGGWKADLDLAEAVLAQRRAEVESLNVLLDRLSVRAPRAAVVLRRDVEPGSRVTADSGPPPLILGDLSRLRVRAQVDEEDIALVRPGAKAVARSRGSVVREVPLSLVRIEPYGRPKTALAGATTERVDTRVIDVVFEIDGTPGVPLYTGQAVDVFIEAAPDPGPTAEKGPG